MKTVLCGMLGLFACAAMTAAPEAFDFSVLESRVQALSAQPYVAKISTVPAWLQAYSYDQHRAITFKPDWSWWRAEGLPFQLQMFHPGWLFKEPVQIHELNGGRESLVGFSTRLFDYGANTRPGPVPEDLGYAGFRIHYALNQPGYLDELVAFLGASYFRALGRGLHYGLSARGLALNTAEPVPEEFPRFEEFWIERPLAGARSVTVFALLNGPNVAGAYRFVITPGVETVMAVQATLCFRHQPAVVGLAPLTSMFLHGENTGWSRDDFRPEVHDSDGLLMQTGAGEWIWRPLSNPSQTRTSVFSDHSPKGFGLFQRDRDFDHYDDVEAHYHQRPSAWVEPVGDWGAGAVRLVEIHTPDETNDNIVAFWVPANLPAAGQPLRMEYKLHWLGETVGLPPGGYVTSTRQGAVLDHPERRRVVVDFTHLPPAVAAAGETLAVVTVGDGARLASEPYVRRIEPTGLWRVAFELTPDGTGRPVELRCFLRNKTNVLSETWSHLWNP